MSRLLPCLLPLPRFSRRSRCAGFTLVEMIMVITITGIIAGMVAVFIRSPVEGYVDAVRRAEMTDQADVALRRIAREVRRALPNSLRLTGDGFEFIITKSGGRYRDPADGSSGGDFLDFTDTGDLSFDVLGALPVMAVGDRIVVYNLGTGYAPADAYSGGNIARVSAIAGTTVTMQSNPFAAQSTPLPSPSGRFQVVDQNELVVRYQCAAGVLRRFQGCTLATPSVCAGAGNVLAGGGGTNVACVIDYVSAETSRNGLLLVSLTLSHSGESVTLFNQIRVDNSP